PAPAPPPPPGPSRASRSPRSASALRRESLMASPPSVGRGRSTRGGRRDLHRADQGPAELTELAIHVRSLPTIVLAPLRRHREVLLSPRLLAPVRDQLDVLELGDLLLEVVIDPQLVHGHDEEDVGRRPALLRDPLGAGAPRL